MNLYELERDAIAELREWRQNNPDEDEPHDTIFEIADSSVPVYTADLLNLAADIIALATSEPELGPASGSNFDGTPSPVNIIASNVFSHLEAKLWEAWQEMKDEEEDDE